MWWVNLGEWSVSRPVASVSSARRRHGDVQLCRHLDELGYNTGLRFSLDLWPILTPTSGPVVSASPTASAEAPEHDCIAEEAGPVNHRRGAFWFPLSGLAARTGRNEIELPRFGRCHPLRRGKTSAECWSVVSRSRFPSPGLRAGRKGCRSSLRRAVQATWSVPATTAGLDQGGDPPSWGSCSRWSAQSAVSVPVHPAWARQRISPLLIP
jgi:hypothetical protein